MKIHPDAETFPLMTEAELDELARDIATHGLRDPLKTDHTGEFLVDGRNRQRACERTGVAPRYEALPLDTDIFAYVISANLHRRHLTDAQRRDIIRQVADRNPDKSNREIAKLAGVSKDTVNRMLSCSTGADEPVEHKTIGADGKSRPASGQINPEIKAAIIADLKANPLAQRDVALKHGVSIGTVSGIKNRLKKAGELVTAAPVPTLAEQLAKRIALPHHDLSREQRGMGTREEGSRQHPDYPPGWTYDHVHREKYGRIQLHSPSEIEERKLVQRFTELVAHLAHLVDENAPTAADLDRLSDLRSREPIVFQIRKLTPRAIDKLSGLLAKLADEPRADENLIDFKQKSGR